MTRRLLDRNFTLLLQGAMVSILGGVVADLAVVWWMIDVAHAPGLVALMNTLSAVVMMAFAPVAGAVVDRSSRKLVLVASDLLTGLVYGGLGAVILYGGLGVDICAWLVVVAVVATDIGGTFFGPASHAAIADLVHRDHLNAANAAMSTGRRIVMVGGQSFGGVLVRLLGMPVLMIVNGVSYIVSGLSELFITFPPRPPSEQGPAEPGLWTTLVEGYRYVVQKPGVFRFVVLYSLLMFFAYPHGMLLLPLYVDASLGAESDWFGYLMAAYAVGGVIGGVVGGMKLRFAGRGRALAVAGMFCAIAAAMAVFAVTRQPGLALVANGVMGASFSVLGVWSMTTYQLSVERSMLGRVISLSMQAVSAASALGLALAGAVLELLPGSVSTLYLGSAIGAGTVALFAMSSPRLWMLFDWRDD